MTIFRLKETSLLRSTFLALTAMAISFQICGYPEVRRCPWLVAPFLLACAAALDTGRCLQKRWSFYHGSVLLMLYADLMVILMISFLLLAPYSDYLL